MQQPILWIHGEALGPGNPALVAYPNQPAVFVFDTELLAGRSATTAEPIGQGAGALSLKRIGFLYECLLELPVSLRRGDVVSEVLGFAREHGADGIVSSAGNDPRLQWIRTQLEQHLPVLLLPVEPFVALTEEPDLGRFSRYWRRAERRVWSQWQP